MELMLETWTRFWFSLISIFYYNKTCPPSPDRLNSPNLCGQIENYELRTVVLSLNKFKLKLIKFFNAVWLL